MTSWNGDADSASPRPVIDLMWVRVQGGGRRVVTGRRQAGRPGSQLTDSVDLGEEVIAGNPGGLLGLGAGAPQSPVVSSGPQCSAAVRIRGSTGYSTARPLGGHPRAAGPRAGQGSAGQGRALTWRLERNGAGRLAAG